MFDCKPRVAAKLEEMMKPRERGGNTGMGEERGRANVIIVV